MAAVVPIPHLERGCSFLLLVAGAGVEELFGKHAVLPLVLASQRIKLLDDRARCRIRLPSRGGGPHKEAEVP
jgi:hypothetical protein